MTPATGLIVGFAQAASSMFGQGTNLIDLDVHARGAHGQPVTDLTADEIRVFEGGKPQKVVFVQHWSTSATPGAGQRAPHQFSNWSENRRPMALVVLNLLDTDVENLQVSETARRSSNSKRAAISISTSSMLERRASGDSWLAVEA
jgi:hypothetical protein